MEITGIFRVAIALAWGATIAVPADAAPATDYSQAYSLALRCVVVTNSVRDETGARRSFDAAMRLGHLQSLSNEQLNNDLAASGVTELKKITQDATYQAQMLAACRKMGLAS